LAEGVHSQHPKSSALPKTAEEDNPYSAAVGALLPVRRKGATLHRPGWVDREVGPRPFRADHLVVR